MRRSGPQPCHVFLRRCNSGRSFHSMNTDINLAASDLEAEIAVSVSDRRSSCKLASCTQPLGIPERRSIYRLSRGTRCTVCPPGTCLLPSSTSMVASSSQLQQAKVRIEIGVGCVRGGGAVCGVYSVFAAMSLLSCLVSLGSQLRSQLRSQRR